MMRDRIRTAVTAPMYRASARDPGSIWSTRKKLVEKGEAYYCFCTQERLDSPKEERQRRGDHGYDKHCLGLSKEEVEANLKAGMPFVIRQNNPKEGDHHLPRRHLRRYQCG